MEAQLAEVTLESLQVRLREGGVSLLEVLRRPESPPLLRLVIAGPADVSGARRAVGTLLAAVGFEGDARGDAELCVGEAASNVLKHAVGGWLEVHLTVSGHLQAWVVDQGPGIPLALLTRCVLEAGWSSKDSAGQGFTVMRALCQRVLLATGASGTTVVLELGTVPLEQPMLG